MTTLRFHIRPARAADAPIIKRMIHSAHLNPIGLVWQRFVVAEDVEGKVIGCAQIKPHADGSRELASVYVVPQARRRGVARAMIQHLLGQTAGEIYLTCRSSLGDFYRQFGFEIAPSQTLPRYYRRIKQLVTILNYLRPSGETLLVMRREG